MKIRNYFIQIDKDIVLSKSFIKELNIQLSELLNREIGETFDSRNTYLHFDEIPINIPDSSTTMTKVTVSYINPYSFKYNLYWKNLKEDAYIAWTDEIKNKPILFWIDDLDSKAIKDFLINYSYLQKKAFLEGYRFVVELKQPDIDILMKIYFKEIISESISDKTDVILSDSIRVYNENNQQQVNGFEGLIHSFLLNQQKKDFTTFKIDLGSAADKGMITVPEDNC